MIGSKKKTEEQNLISEISGIQKVVKYTYGTSRITDHLNDKGIKVNHKKVSRVIRENGANQRTNKKFKNTTESSHNKQTSPNIFDRDFYATAPNQKRVSDITYIYTAEGWLYLFVNIDLCSRKIVGIIRVQGLSLKV